MREALMVYGCRTPFARSGTDLADFTSYDLGRTAVAGLINRLGLDPGVVDLLVMGTVLQDPATSNLGREVALGAGLPSSCPAYTVTMACVSSLQSALDGVRAIRCGDADVVIAAGAETLSDVPIRLSKNMRKKIIEAQKARGLRGYLDLLPGLRPSDLVPEQPAIAEFFTGETMGENAERLAKRWGISREEQDEYALRSHRQAAEATEAGYLGKQIVPIYAPDGSGGVHRDTGVRGDTSPEKLARLKPAFDRHSGTVTAGNSSYLTDGAAAVLLAGEDVVEELGLRPMARVGETSVTAGDPRDELLLGPVFSIPRVLDSAGVDLDEVEVLEFHEAFAAQILTVMGLLENDNYLRSRVGRDGVVGHVDPERLNLWGGSLSLGHPFGATGARLLMNCAARMEHEDSKLGLVASCAAGALGTAVLLEAV